MTTAAPAMDAKIVTADIGVFAHNEATKIADLVADIGASDIFGMPELDLRILILANGCTDDTATVSKRAIATLPSHIADRFLVLDLPEGGKSRTTHSFIHTLSRPDADLLGFMDADIRLPQTDSLRRMAEQMRARPELHAFTSRPVKDVVHDRSDIGAIAKLIAAGGDNLSNYRKSICGQLYFLRTASARQIGLPVGLPVEDGFVRAMILTDLLSAPEDLERIDGQDDIFHVYESIRTIGALLRHQARLVTGSAINAALFRKLRRDAPTQRDAHKLLMEAALDESWLPWVLSEELPTAPYGYVPFHFLIKRLQRGPGRGLKGVIVLAAGFALDAIAWIMATVRLMRRKGAGHW